MADSEVLVRRATLDDFRGVLEIEDDIYEGFDYLPTTYYEFIQNKNSFPVVVVVNNKIVGFVNLLLMDDGRRALSMAGRISSKYRGMRLSERAISFCFRELKKVHPQLTLMVWTKVNHPHDRKYLELDTVKVRWRLYAFEANQDVIQLFSQREPSVPVNRIRRLSPEQSARIFSDAASRTRLFPDEYIVAQFFWCPFPVNEANLKFVSKSSTVTAIFSEGDSTCENVAFISHLKVTSGVRLDVWIYGTQVTPSVVLAHVYYCMRKVPSTVTSLKFMVHFPIHVNQDEVKRHLAIKLGDPMVTSTFDSDEAICCDQQMALSSNL